MRVAMTIMAAALNLAAADSRPFPSSPVVYGRIEERPCPSGPSTDRLMLYACHNGLKYSPPRACWMAVTYKDGKEAESTYLCTPECVKSELKPDKPCNDACFSAFFGKVAYRSAGALEPETQSTLSRWYRDLISLAKSSGKTDSPERQQLKQNIMATILREMIPYDNYCAPQRGKGVAQENFVYLAEYSGRVPEGVHGVNPLGTTAGGELIVFESAFYNKDFTPVSPDELAAELVHEMAHWNQQNYGHAEGGDGRTGAWYPKIVAAEKALNDIMAYDKTEAHPFFVNVLAQEQRRNHINVGRIAVTNTFMTIWDGLSQPERQRIADWAWHVEPRWMASMMKFHGMQDCGVWGRLYAAKSPGNER